MKNQNPKNAEKNKKKISTPLLILLIVLGVIAVGAIAVGILINRKPTVTAEIPVDETIFEPETDDNGNPLPASGTTTARREGMYNFLIVGRDKVALNTDVIMVASIDTVNSVASSVHIPRDSYVVDENDGGASKINAVFAKAYSAAKKTLNGLKKEASDKSADELAAYEEKLPSGVSAADFKDFVNGNSTVEELAEKAGIDLLEQVIRNTFGIYIDYYAVVSTDAFVKIIDAIGGVDVYVQERMYYVDPLQDLYIDIPQGNQHLDGKKAEGFVRFRSGYAAADLARIEAQKIFLTALFKKLTSPSIITKVPDILTIAYQYVDTNISLTDAMAFVKPALSIDLGSISMMTMQGVGASANGLGSCLSLDKKTNLEIVNNYFNIFNRRLSENAVKVHELVSISESGELPASTMEDISENQPHLYFVHGSGGGSSSSGTGSSTTPSTPSAGKSENNPSPSSGDGTDVSSDLPDDTDEEPDETEEEPDEGDIPDDTLDGAPDEEIPASDGEEEPADEVPSSDEPAVTEETPDENVPADVPASVTVPADGPADGGNGDDSI